jgi:hypothetical protein
MKKQLLSFLFLVNPLMGQDYEIGVFWGKQSYKSINTQTTAAYYGEKVDSQSRSVSSIRFGYSIVDLGPFLLQATVGYQPEVKTDTQQWTDTAAGSSHFNTKHEYWSVGAMLNLKVFTAVGVGLDYRSENLSIFDTKTTYRRPWVRLNSGVIFPTLQIKPFVGIELSAPLTSSSNDVHSTNEEFLKRTAPKLQIGIYGGVRF